MNVGYLITGRLKSTRLPKKLLREIKGKPILWHMLDRLRLAKRVDQIILCTSPDEEDRPLVEMAAAAGVACHCGDPDDVILRLLGATRQFKLDYCLNITADCPFVDPVYADKIVEAFLETKADLIRAFDLPHGAFSYGIRPEALAKVVEVKDSKETEVWGRYFTDTDLFKVYDLPIENRFHRKPLLRMTLDYPEDLAFFQAVFDELYREGEVFSLDQILGLLERRPDIVAINSFCRKAFTRRITKQAEISLKPRYPTGKAAVIGCGSIGQRHVRNLRKLGITDIVAVRSRQGHFRDLPPELGIREVATMDGLLAERPDFAIISNPTSLHLETIDRIVPNVKGIFIEKPIAASLDGVESLLHRFRESGTVSFVGYDLEFHPAVIVMRNLLADGELGEPLTLQCQVGQWLPNWHPYEDYRAAYYARAELGGGVIRTLSHEIHLAQQLLGNFTSVCGMFPPHDSLPLEVDVIADVMSRHASGAVSQIHLDYLQRPAHRCGTIACTAGWIQYDLTNGQVTVQSSADKTPRLAWDGSGYDPNQEYVDEIDTFLRYVREGRVRHPYDAWRAAASLAAVVTALEAAQERCERGLPRWVCDLR
jgi:spore coat polysaccharide biosynthesis protein SpsF